MAKSPTSAPASAPAARRRRRSWRKNSSATQRKIDRTGTGRRVRNHPLPPAEALAANPAFIIEILSDSTETYDRGGKFHRYQTLPSLREYVLVSQHTIAVDVYRRHEAGWLYQSLQSLGDILRLDSVDAAAPLAEIYRGVFG